MQSMAKKPNKTSARNPRTTYLVKNTADICGVSESTVYKVIDGTRNNEKVLGAYMTLSEKSNDLLEAVRKMVPFN